MPPASTRAGRRASAKWDSGGQRRYLRIVRYQVLKQPSEAEHLRNESGALADASGIGMGEGIGDLHRRQHRVQPLGPALRQRHFERYASLGDLALGADQPLSECRLRHQKGARNLVGVKPAHRLERQRHPRLLGEGRVTADEDQPQPFVGDEAGIEHLLSLLVVGLGQQRALGSSMALAHRTSAQQVDRGARGGAIKPGRRVIRRARQPCGDGPRARLRIGLFGQIKVAEAGGEGGDHASARCAVRHPQRIVRQQHRPASASPVALRRRRSQRAGFYGQ